MVVLWDWNGTLLDDVAYCVAVNNRVLPRFGYAQTDVLRYRSLFRFPVRDYYRDLGITDADFDAVARCWTEEYLAGFPRIPLHGDALSTVIRLHNSGICQRVISATRHDLLTEQLMRFPDLTSRLDGWSGIQDIYADSKVDMAVRYFRENDLDPAEAVFIGDTGHDAETAAAIGCRCLLVSRGHQKETVLRRSGVPVMGSLAQAADWVLAQKTGTETPR